MRIMLANIVPNTGSIKPLTMAAAAPITITGISLLFILARRCRGTSWYWFDVTSDLDFSGFLSPLDDMKDSENETNSLNDDRFLITCRGRSSSAIDTSSMSVGKFCSEAWFTSCKFTSLEYAPLLFSRSSECEPDGKNNNGNQQYSRV